MIEEAIVDCYNEDEQHGGFLVMLEENLACPMSALVVGAEVTVSGFDWNPPGEIVARCRRGDREHMINVTALEWPGSQPSGAEWIQAYRLWLRGH
ncbi:MAG: calcium-binding protein [Actinomycetota bacterium]